jgi:hypothetical protein
VQCKGGVTGGIDAGGTVVACIFRIIPCGNFFFPTKGKSRLILYRTEKNHHHYYYKEKN